MWTEKSKLHGLIFVDHTNFSLAYTINPHHSTPWSDFHCPIHDILDKIKTVVSYTCMRYEVSENKSMNNNRRNFMLFAMYNTKQFVHVHKNCVITPLLIINHLTHSILLFTFLLINHYIHKFLLILTYHRNFVNCHYYGKLWIPSIIIKVLTNLFPTKFNFTSYCFKCVINRIPFLPIQIKNLFKRFLISSRDELSHDQFEALDWLAMFSRSKSTSSLWIISWIEFRWNGLFKQTNSAKFITAGFFESIKSCGQWRDYWWNFLRLSYVARTTRINLTIPATSKDIVFTLWMIPIKSSTQLKLVHK